MKICQHESTSSSVINELRTECSMKNWTLLTALPILHKNRNGMAKATRLRLVVSKARCIFPSVENLLASSLRSPLPSVEEPCPLSLSDGLLQQPTLAVAKKGRTKGESRRKPPQRSGQGPSSETRGERSEDRSGFSSRGKIRVFRGIPPSPAEKGSKPFRFCFFSHWFQPFPQAYHYGYGAASMLTSRDSDCVCFLVS